MSFFFIQHLIKYRHFFFFYIIYFFVCGVQRNDGVGEAAVIRQSRSLRNHWWQINICSWTKLQQINEHKNFQMVREWFLRKMKKSKNLILIAKLSWWRIYNVRYQSRYRKDCGWRRLRIFTNSFDPIRVNELARIAWFLTDWGFVENNQLLSNRRNRNWNENKNNFKLSNLFDKYWRLPEMYIYIFYTYIYSHEFSSTSNNRVFCLTATRQ